MSHVCLVQWPCFPILQRWRDPLKHNKVYLLDNKQIFRSFNGNTRIPQLLLQSLCVHNRYSIIKFFCVCSFGNISSTLNEYLFQRSFTALLLRHHHHPCAQSQGLVKHTLPFAVPFSCPCPTTAFPRSVIDL